MLTTTQRVVIALGVAALVMSLICVPTFCESYDGKYMGFRGYMYIGDVIETASNARWALKILFPLLFSQLLVVSLGTIGLVMAASKRK